MVFSSCETNETTERKDHGIVRGKKEADVERMLKINNVRANSEAGRHRIMIPLTGRHNQYTQTDTLQLNFNP